MLSRDQKLHSLERYIYRKLGLCEGAAYLFSNIIGVIIDVKPAAQCDWPLSSADAKSMWLLKQKLEALKLFVLFGENEGDRKVFYVAKSQKRAATLRCTFDDLHNCGATAENQTEIGKLLGYPDTAIQYYIRLHPEKGISDNHRALIERNRFYAHSVSHENEEFTVYEQPIYSYLRRHCPRTANFYKKSTEKRWLD